MGAEEPSYYLQEVNRTKKDGPFLVHFHGFFIPLHGIQYILEAAKLLENEEIQFNIIGSGQTFPDMKKHSQWLRNKNVTFVPPLEYKILLSYILSSDICLGIFGGTKKSDLVIPNKVFEAISLQRPVVTGNSSAIREIFEGGKNIFLVEMANPKALAEAILKLKSNQTLYFEMARNGYRLFEEKFKPRIIVKDLATCIFNEINPHF